ncbi:MAG: peptidase MA family metallohydrolase [SAR202 cluster bacterium]|nr:peptidase MA family metallohydrolase [SAR202 cluster bacterium]MDP6714238.1 peptidase MA family metallohydrolase [SAR202 cluster bacterium]
MIYGLVALAMGAMIGLGGADAAPIAGMNGSTLVVSAEHRIEFPDRIVLELEAESVENVVNVQLFYRIGRQDALIYGYPNILRTSGGVSAEFVISTASSGFIPSGVDIEYYYAFQDSDGQTVESERFTIEYLDPRYNWQRYDAGTFEILWHDRPRPLVEGVADEVNQHLLPVLSMFGVEGLDKMKAVITNGSRESGRTFPRVSQTASDGQLYSGFAFGEYDVFLLAGLGVDGMIHEMTHLFFDEAINSPRAKVPAWVNEGLAMYFERGTGGRESIVSNAARSGSLFRLDSMGAVPGRPSDVRIFYAQSWSLVTFMIETFGTERMSAMLTALNNGQPIEQAIQTAYGLTSLQLESGWRTQLRTAASFTQVIDPGSFGTSVIITGALLVTATVVTVRWLRRDREPAIYED